jgi:hypothetical protein
MLEKVSHDMWCNYRCVFKVANLFPHNAIVIATRNLYRLSLA